MEGLVDISNQVEKVSGHESPLEADSFLIRLQHALAPVDDVDRVDILLVLCHALESEVGIVWTA